MSSVLWIQWSSMSSSNRFCCSGFRGFLLTSINCSIYFLHPFETTFSWKLPAELILLFLIFSSASAEAAPAANLAVVVQVALLSILPSLDSSRTPSLCLVFCSPCNACLKWGILIMNFCWEVLLVILICPSLWCCVKNRVVLLSWWAILECWI